MYIETSILAIVLLLVRLNISCDELHYLLTMVIGLFWGRWETGSKLVSKYNSTIHQTNLTLKVPTKVARDCEKMCAVFSIHNVAQLFYSLCKLDGTQETASERRSELEVRCARMHTTVVLWRSLYPPCLRKFLSVTSQLTVESRINRTERKTRV